jgi:hypothetical protein
MPPPPPEEKYNHIRVGMNLSTIKPLCFPTTSSNTSSMIFRLSFVSSFLDALDDTINALT